MTVTNITALTALRPNTTWGWAGDGSDYLKLDWKDETSKPSESDIAAKKTALENAEPMHVLRMLRDAKLAETDWTSLPDSPLSSDKKSEWGSYRQSLRTLPATADPRLDGSGNLTNVTWPAKPA